MITRGGVERILVRACAKRGMTETGSAGSCERFSGFAQMILPFDMVVVDGKEGEEREWLNGRVEVLVWGIATLNLTLF